MAAIVFTGSETVQTRIIPCRQATDYPESQFVILSREQKRANLNSGQEEVNWGGSLHSFCFRSQFAGGRMNPESQRVYY